MPTQVVALSGPSGSGKSALAAELRRILGPKCVVVSTSAILKGQTDKRDREALFAFGEELDAQRPEWFLGSPHGTILPIDPDAVVIVDAVRSGAQAAIVRRAGGVVVHALDESGVVDKSMGTHQASDPRCYLGSAGEAGPRTRALALLERLGFSRGVDALVGAQWGSEGKGKIAAWLASRRVAEGHPYAALGRAGGPNAGHRVELPSGDYFVFRHLPSATPHAVPGSILVVGPGAVLDLAVLAREVAHVPDDVRVVVDPRAAIVTQHDRWLETEAGLTEIGSTMTGTGGAMASRVLRKGTTAADVEAGSVPAALLGLDDATHRAMVDWFQGRVAPAGRALREAACRGRIQIEATQGLELSLFHGTYPKVTSRDVSPAGLLSEMGLPPDLFVDWFVVARTYPIRVSGPSGELPGECSWADVAATSGRSVESLEKAERTSVTNRLRRVARWRRGHLLDVVTRALSDRSTVRVAITFADYLDGDRAALDEIMREAAAASNDRPVIVGYGPATAEAYQTT